MFRNLPPVCRGILAALLLGAVASLVAPSLVESMVPLAPERVLHHFELWRLATYPFYFMASGRTLIGNIISLAWIGMLIAFFGAELETIVHSDRVALALGGTVLGSGALFLLVSPQGVLAGPSILTMFVLGGFAYLWPRREISIFGLFWVKAWIIALAIFLFSIIPMSGLNLDTSASNLFEPIAGALGAMVYLHIVYRQYAFGRALLQRFHRPGAARKEAIATSGDPRDIERRIDAILDKITTGGMESLSKDERAFLLEHSK